MASAQSVRSHSTELKKELGLADLVLTQIMYVVGTGWVGTAAKLGNQQIVFWLAAILLFYAPLAAAVIYLNRLMPLEGGLYQWAKLGFNDFIGFLVGWNLWLYVILIVATLGVGIANNLGYAFGLGATGSATWFMLLVICLLVTFLVVVTMLGLGVGKWFQNAGGLAQVLAFGTLILVPFFVRRGGPASAYHPLAVATPAISLLSLNIFSKISMGAFSGFEYVAILAGECKNPRNIGKSVLIASPIICLMFILGTSSVLAFVRPDQVDLVGPIPQVLTLALGRFQWAALIAPTAILLLIGRQIGNCTLSTAGSARLPMVAGWDHLLPEWFSRLHPKYKTPVNSILVVGTLILALGLLGISGVGQQEAFQILDNAAGVFYALAYLAMFALPLFGLRKIGQKPPLWLRATMASGFLVTLLYCVMSLFPIINVASRLSFAAKIGGVIVGSNVIGAWLYRLGIRRRAG
ncbi:MAG TPA: APC family permease [Bryobacteraceae bacterium]|nr:APC family permease [Bryobacteraceae bacterium]